MKFAIAFQPLTGQIAVGRLSKAGNAFLEKEYLDLPTVVAAAEYVHTHYPEGMEVKRPDGSGWVIAVEPIEPRAGSTATSGEGPRR